MKVLVDSQDGVKARSGYRSGSEAGAEARSSAVLYLGRRAVRFREESIVPAVSNVSNKIRSIS